MRGNKNNSNLILDYTIMIFTYLLIIFGSISWGVGGYQLGKRYFGVWFGMLLMCTSILGSIINRSILSQPEKKQQEAESPSYILMILTVIGMFSNLMTGHQGAKELWIMADCANSSSLKSCNFEQQITGTGERFFIGCLSFSSFLANGLPSMTSAEKFSKWVKAIYEEIKVDGLKIKNTFQIMPLLVAIALLIGRGNSINEFLTLGLGQSDKPDAIPLIPDSQEWSGYVLPVLAFILNVPNGMGLTTLTADALVKYKEIVHKLEKRPIKTVLSLMLSTLINTFLFINYAAQTSAFLERIEMDADTTDWLTLGVFLLSIGAYLPKTFAVIDPRIERLSANSPEKPQSLIINELEKDSKSFAKLIGEFGSWLPACCKGEGKINEFSPLI